MASTDALVRDLTAGSPRAKLAAVRLAVKGRVTDPRVVAALAGLLASRDVSPRDASWALALHEPVAPAAAEALLALGAVDDAVVDAAVALAAAGSAANWSFPQASFDQGQYIGEYGGEEVVPAAFACELAGRAAAVRAEVRGRVLAALARAAADPEPRVRDTAREATTLVKGATAKRSGGAGRT